MAHPQITYRGMPHSAAMDRRIGQLAAKLDELHPRITSCHVVVDEADHHRQQGNLFIVHVDVHAPGVEAVATHQRHQDAYVALGEAFDAVIRQLEDAVRKRRDRP